MKEQLKHVNFQLHHAHSQPDLDNQIIPHVGAAFQNHLPVQLKFCAHKIDVRYQTKLHLWEIRRFGESRYLTRQHRDLDLSGRRSYLPS